MSTFKQSYFFLQSASTRCVELRNGVKVKFSLEHVTTAQIWNRGLAVLGAR
jgi:hypothetical protein